jgi:hypothetical protein
MTKMEEVARAMVRPGYASFTHLTAAEVEQCVDECMQTSNGDRYRNLARAALQALREPTEGMLHGARDWSVAKYGIGVGIDGATGCWHAMIDAALNEKT